MTVRSRSSSTPNRGNDRQHGGLTLWRGGLKALLTQAPKTPRRIIIVSLLAVTALFLGCQSDEARAYKMHQTSGKMTRGSDGGYRATCTHQVAGGQESLWTGTMYPEKERAMRDAVQHNKQFPGHDATFEH